MILIVAIHDDFSSFRKLENSSLKSHFLWIHLFQTTNWNTLSLTFKYLGSSWLQAQKPANLELVAIQSEKRQDVMNMLRTSWMWLVQKLVRMVCGHCLRKSSTKCLYEIVKSNLGMPQWTTLLLWLGFPRMSSRLQGQTSQDQVLSQLKVWRLAGEISNIQRSQVS